MAQPSISSRSSLKKPLAGPPPGKKAGRSRRSKAKATGQTRIDPDGLSPELILNRALIDAKTNQSIGSKKPSVYIEDMETSGADVDAIFESHLASADIARWDDYRSLIEDRLSRVIERIEAVTGRSVDPPTSTEPAS